MPYLVPELPSKRKLKRYFEAERRIVHIAAEYGCDEKTIRRLAKKYELVHPNSPKMRAARATERIEAVNAVAEYESGTSLAVLAREADVAIDTLKKYLVGQGVELRSNMEQTARTMEKYGTRFYENVRVLDRIEGIIAMREDEATYREIADFYGIDKRTVKRVLKRHAPHLTGRIFRKQQVASEVENDREPLTREGIENMKAVGFSVSQIAQRFDYEVTEVFDILYG